MFTLQPIRLRRYLSFHRLVVPPQVRRVFFTSWEDALWDLLLFFQIPKRSICLVPDFFCMDVVKNMEDHGLQCIFYPVDSQLHTDTHVFSSLLKQHQPKVVVILHSAGITNQLFFEKNIWLRHLPKHTLLIEDCVHRLVDPQQINLLAPRHFVIDSLRKVAPLYGSNLYGDTSTLRNFKQSGWWLTLSYQLQVFWWWWLFQCCLHAGWNTLAQKFMEKGYDLIGDSKRAAPGPWFFSFLSQYLNLARIVEVKKQQVARYHTVLNECWSNPLVYQIMFDQLDVGKLRGYPIGINLENADQLLVQLQERQLAWKYELDDCPWSKRQKIVYLPLGPHLELQEIEKICESLISLLSCIDQ